MSQSTRALAESIGEGFQPYMETAFTYLATSIKSDKCLVTSTGAERRLQLHDDSEDGEDDEEAQFRYAQIFQEPWHKH